ncbi:hypothetical protein IVB16_32130 [Bradyrhizobium sp. 183]|uniref:hypothetical protein n=1 Tax=unclassified Bradyrhizobium TaxID=2631580 RepID=UPI001FFE63C8|nr:MULTISPECIES: hypothetical protein [unclassified Bradyrhizobium]UPJ79344.1 hypothetical protein IVB17_32130 [Bradyrhizobium sp. 184]UPJ87138.1 hypothetical protein IVB16_32130 [Bradyrhizobium sp. 183]
MIAAGKSIAARKFPARFVIAGGDSSIQLESAEELLDEVANLVGFFVKIALGWLVASGRVHARLSASKHQFDHLWIGIEDFVWTLGGLR